MMHMPLEGKEVIVSEFSFKRKLPNVFCEPVDGNIGEYV